MPVDVSALRAELENRGNRAFVRASNQAFDELIDRAPYRDGELVDSGRLLSEVGAGGDTYSGRIEFTAPQALWTDEGTRPHEIEGNPWLVFEVGGETIFVKSPRVVNHPGTPRTGWFSDYLTDDGWAQLCQQGWDGG